jgi:hypothetical protein
MNFRRIKKDGSISYDYIKALEYFDIKKYPIEKRLRFCKNYYHYCCHGCCDKEYFCDSYYIHDEFYDGLNYKQVFYNIKHLYKNEIDDGTLKKMKYKEFLQTSYWFYISLYIKYDRKFHCEICKKETFNLNVHHVDYSIKGNEHLYVYDRTKLRCLCNKCHEKEHGLGDYNGS